MGEKMVCNVMLEKEYKVLLSKSQYEKIKNKFSFGKIDTQINFYYGNNCDNDTTIRVRWKNGKKFLQIKESVLKKNGIHIKNEYQKEIEVIPEYIQGYDLNKMCNSNKYSTSFFVGELITERRIVNIQKCEIAIDINYYLGMIDYELEIEFQDMISPEILQFLKKENIYLETCSDGKFSRFYNRLAEQKLRKEII